MPMLELNPSKAASLMMILTRSSGLISLITGVMGLHRKHLDGSPLHPRNAAIALSSCTLHAIRGLACAGYLREHSRGSGVDVPIAGLFIAILEPWCGGSAVRVLDRQRTPPSPRNDPQRRVALLATSRVAPSVTASRRILKRFAPLWRLSVPMRSAISPSSPRPSRWVARHSPISRPRHCCVGRHSSSVRLAQLRSLDVGCARTQ